MAKAIFWISQNQEERIERKSIKLNISHGLKRSCYHLSINAFWLISAKRIWCHKVLHLKPLAKTALSAIYYFVCNPEAVTILTFSTKTNPWNWIRHIHYHNGIHLMELMCILYLLEFLTSCESQVCGKFSSLQLNILYSCFGHGQNYCFVVFHFAFPCSTQQRSLWNVIRHVF